MPSVKDFERPTYNVKPTDLEVEEITLKLNGY